VGTNQTYECISALTAWNAYLHKRMLCIILNNEDTLTGVSTRTAAVALGVAPKLLDNILAREARSLVAPGRRGRERRITFAALERIAIALVLNRDVGVSIARGLELAGQLLREPGVREPGVREPGVREPGVRELSLGSLTMLRFDAVHLNRALESACIEAVDELMPPRRGRTPRVDRATS
jgi:hypothetical protein